MKNNLLQKLAGMGCAALVFALTALGQEHQWAGRALDNFEWAIHEKLAVLPSYGVFDTIDFEVQGKTVTLTGKVVGERVRHRAERAVGRIEGVESVLNHIEVLPSSRRDNALRMNMYRAIYEKENSGAHADFPVHIIVKDGWVTLEGVVESDADRSSFHLRALQVTAHVSDNLRVVPDSRAALNGSGQ